jgi:FkbM family methyltransferase
VGLLASSVEAGEARRSHLCTLTFARCCDALSFAVQRFRVRMLVSATPPSWRPGETQFQRIQRVFASARLAGWSAFVSLAAAQRISRHVARGRRLRLFSKYSNVGLVYRAGASDLDAFRQIFVDREYRCLDDIADAGLVVDCGANVGYSSAYFLSRFPRCRVIAVEPDAANFEVLQNNLHRFGGRVTALKAGVWPRRTGLRFSEEKFRDGREWSHTVREARPGESSDLDGIDIGSLLRTSGFERISILKIDVEGAERHIFAENYEDWLGKVDVMIVELHGPECADVFHRAIGPFAFELSTCDELTVARRR